MNKWVWVVLVVCLAVSAPARAQVGGELSVPVARPNGLNLLPVRYTFANGMTQNLPATSIRLPNTLLGEPSPTRELARPKGLIPLYASMGALQALDAVSTYKAISAGGHEANPLMAPVVGSPAGLVALKVGVTTSMIYASERLWKTNRKAAIWLLIGTNIGYAAIVANNFAIAKR